MERDHWGDPDIDGGIILRWIFRKWEGVVGTGWSWLRIEAGDGPCEYGDEPSGCLRQPTLPLSIRINTGSLYRNVSILNYKRDKDNVS